MLAVMLITLGPQLRQAPQGKATSTSWLDSQLFQFLLMGPSSHKYLNARELLKDLSK